MKWIYSITMKTATGGMARYCIISPDRAKAEAVACKLANVPVGTEPETTLRQPDPVDGEAE